MIATDENALICDLAETYNIYDYRSLPLRKVATFSVGLRDNSRIKMKMNGLKIPLNEILLAAAVDRLSLLLWTKTEDGMRNINRPKSILDELLGNDEKETEGFDTPEDFITAWNKITKEDN